MKGRLALVVALAAVTMIVLPPLTPAHAQAAELYVAPGANGAGSAADPASLAGVLAGTVAPGTTVWVGGGTYTGCFPSKLQGTPDAPVIVRARPGERPILDGAGCTKDSILDVVGADSWFWGLEITNSDPNRTTSEAGSNPQSYRRAAGVALRGARTKLINSYVHDNGVGIGMWDAAVDAEVYGCVVFHNGWIGPDRGHGHGIYVQNSTGTKQINDTIVADNYEMGVHAYGQAGKAIGIHIDGLIAVHNGRPASNGDPVRAANVFVGTTEYPADDVSLTNSVSYQDVGTVGGGVRLGYSTKGNGTVDVRDNLLASGAQDLNIDYWRQATVTGNTFVATSTKVPTANSFLATARTEGGPVTWDGNSYFDTTPVSDGERYSFAFNGSTYRGGERLPYEPWRSASGFDASSSYTDGLPGGQLTSVRVNRYEPGRLLVSAVGWSQPLGLDLSAAGITAGSRVVAVDPFSRETLADATWTGEPVYTWDEAGIATAIVDVVDAAAAPASADSADPAAPPAGPPVAAASEAPAQPPAAVAAPPRTPARPNGTVAIEEPIPPDAGRRVGAVALAAALIIGNLILLALLRRGRRLATAPSTVLHVD